MQRVSRKTFEDLRIEMRTRVAKAVKELLTEEYGPDRQLEYMQKSRDAFSQFRVIARKYLVLKNLLSF